MIQITGTSGDKLLVRRNYIIIYAFKHKNRETIPALINRKKTSSALILGRLLREAEESTRRRREESAQSEEEEEKQEVIYHSDLFSQ